MRFEDVKIRQRVRLPKTRHCPEEIGRVIGKDRMSGTCIVRVEKKYRDQTGVMYFDDGLREVETRFIRALAS